MGQPGPRNELVGRSQVAQNDVVGNACQWLAQGPQGRARPFANRDHDVGMGFVGLVEHSVRHPLAATLPTADVALPLKDKG